MFTIAIVSRILQNVKHGIIVTQDVSIKTRSSVSTIVNVIYLLLQTFYSGVSDIQSVLRSRKNT